MHKLVYISMFYYLKLFIKLFSFFFNLIVKNKYAKWILDWSLDPTFLQFVVDRPSSLDLIFYSTSKLQVVVTRQEGGGMDRQYYHNKDSRSCVATKRHTFSNQTTPEHTPIYSLQLIFQLFILFTTIQNLLLVSIRRQTSA